MRVLITNDDGIDSPGLHVLASAAVRAGLDVVVAAPSWDSSGASASFTAVESEGRVVQEARRFEDPAGVPAYAVEAAPAFIVRAVLAGSVGPVPDLVLSGANHGPNAGNAILHSGTVGAALTAAALGIPALATSVATSTGAVQHWDTVIAVLDRLLPVFVAQPVPVLNLNVPDVPPGRLAGVRAATLAPVGAVSATVTERGSGHLHLAYVPTDGSQPVGSDMELLSRGCATLTSLRPVCAAPPEEVTPFLSAGHHDGQRDDVGRRA